MIHDESEDDPVPDDAMDVQDDPNAAGVDFDDEGEVPRADAEGHAGAPGEAGAEGQAGEGDRPVIVNGVELNLECSPAQALGLGGAMP